MIAKFEKFMNQHHWAWIISLQALFIGLAIIIYYHLLISSGNPYQSNDFFHWRRIINGTESLKRLHIPYYDDYTELHGNATMTCYPWLTFVPFMLLYIAKVPPVIIIRLLGILGFVLGADIAYYSYFKCKLSKKQALTFALLYSTCPNIIDKFLYFNEFAEYLAFMMVPLAFLGWLKIVRHGSYKMMTVGLILISFTHLPTIIITLGTLVLMTTLVYRHLDKATVKSFVTGGLISIFCTACYWLPMIVLLHANQVYLPRIKHPIGETAALIPINLHMILINALAIFSVTLIACIIMVIMRFSTLNYISRIFVLVMSLVLWLNSFLLPWKWLDATLLNHLQFTYRTMFIVFFMMAYLVTELIFHNWTNENISKVARIAFIIFLVYVGILEPFIGTNNFVRHTSIPLYHIEDYKYMREHLQSIANTISNRQYNSYKMRELLIYPDYAPKRFISKSHSFYVPYHEHYSYNKGNVLHFTVLSGHHNIRLPFIMYHQQHYGIRINHSHGHIFINHNRPVIPYLPKGKYVMSVRAPLMWYHYVGFVLSLIGIIWLCLPYRKHVD